jgi:hypothetical protein
VQYTAPEVYNIASIFAGRIKKLTNRRAFFG